MLSRRALLTALGAAAVGTAGCAERLRNPAQSAPPIDGSCDNPAATWRMAGGGPGRTGQTNTVPPAPDADAVDLLGDVRGEDGRQMLASALPAVADGTAYVPASTEVVAVDIDAPEAGAVWRYDHDGGDFDTVPVLTCGAVVVPGLNRLAALDRGTGGRYWQADVGGYGPSAAAAAGETTYVAGPQPVAVGTRTGNRQWTATGETVAVGSSGIYTTRTVNRTGGVRKYDFDGEERWHLALGKTVGSVSVADRTVYAVDNRGTVYAIDAGTGVTRWSRSLAGVEEVHTGLAVTDETVVVPAGNGRRSVALDAATGEVQWQLDTGIVTGRPVVGDDWVAFGRTNAGITLHDLADGTQRAAWSREHYGFGTIDGLAPVEDGFVVRGGTTSGLTLLR
ncbi:hypothetical protein BRC72_11230 [Halobacteriales archaeon QH_7_66_36]|nr:MAG: hypothetical protein BRC72_11230 [Halobacteriales archaeon QH_7_66_36]